MSKKTSTTTKSATSSSAGDETSSSARPSSSELGKLVTDFVKSYEANTSGPVKVLDAYLVFCLLIAGLQIFFVFLVGSFPFNTFLAGFVMAVGAFVCGASLRMQLTIPAQFKNRSHARAFSEFIFANLVLFLGVLNYIG